MYTYVSEVMVDEEQLIEILVYMHLWNMLE